MPGGLDSLNGKLLSSIRIGKFTCDLDWRYKETWYIKVIQERDLAGRRRTVIGHLQCPIGNGVNWM